MSFRKFTWYDERSEGVIEYFRNNRTVERVEILTVFDCNKAMGGVLEAIAMNKGIKELKIAINMIGAEEILYIVKMIQDSENLTVIDLSHEIVEEQRQ